MAYNEDGKRAQPQERMTLRMNSTSSIDIQSLLNTITSPLVHISRSGEMLAANPTGACHWDSLLLLAEPLKPGTVPLGEMLASLQHALCPCLLACEEALVRLSPLPPEGAILEWLPVPGDEKLAMFQEVGKAVNSSLILEDIFESLGDVLRKYIPYREATIVILDDTQNGIKILVRFVEEGLLEITGENNAFAGYDPVVDRIVRDPVSHLYGVGQLPESVVFSQDAASAIVVPLVNKGVVIGLIALSTDQESGFCT